jgi:hypothetical protein
MREGVWTYTDGRYKAVANYHHDKIDGTLKIEAVPETRQPATLAVFDAGRLTEFNGRPVTDHLFEVRESRPLDERTWNELGKETQIDFVEVPLKDAIDFLKDKHNLPIALDVKHVPNIDLPLTECYSGLDLAVVFSLLTAPHGLACDYRYGCLWITSAKDAKDWHDPTGVANLKPPQGSALEGCWNERVPRLDIVNASLADVLNAFQRELTTGDIDLQATSSGGVSPSVTIQSPEGLPFRHVLGQMLYFTGCRCKLEGDKLVILPPEEKP